ncbi:hypothetical protein ONZ45_g2358 [Pleurotus djamor]|nr:hypothetical protein ONZ45_g2358 [Pleurotus djamor]
MAIDSPPALQEATSNSTSAWQHDLESLFHHAKDRFPDVVWELAADDEGSKAADEVWGHKAIVYARAPPSFQNRYFSLRPGGVSSPSPYAQSPNGAYPTTSALSLSLGLEIPGVPRSPSPFRTGSPAPSNAPGTVLRLSTSINPTLFSNELEYLYTGKGIGEAFEFLFDSTEAREEGDAEEVRMDKLRKDLVFMWRSRLYSDVRISLTGSFSSHHEDTTAVFSSHRFVLISRSSYFYNALMSWSNPSKHLSGEPATITLPSPPFTPASLHFTLGFIYTGTLVFSHRSYDMDTAFHIMRSATYLSIQTLYDEVQARIVQEMMHGLFHAFLEFSEYERLTNGKWALPQRLRDTALKGVGKRTTPSNALALLYAAEHAIIKLGPVIDAWADIVREMIYSARKVIDDCLASKADECFAQQDWMDMMENDGVRFEDGERVEWIMAAIKRGTLVSAVLLALHPTEPDQPMLSDTSHIRVQVDETRMDVLRYIKKRWLSIRQEGGFDQLDGWALKEIADELDVAVDDLNTPAQRNTMLRHSMRPKLEQESDTGSMHSLRASVLNGKSPTTTKRTSPSVHRGPSSSAASVRSVARSTVSRLTVDPNATVRPKKIDPRPDSKLTPPNEDIIPPLHSSHSSDRHYSSSIRTRTSTVASSRASAGPSNLRPARPTSSLSTATTTASDGSGTFKTANTAVSVSSRSRRTSNASTLSTASVKTTGSTATSPRSRRTSVASTVSTVSTTPSRPIRRPPVPSLDPNKLSPSAAKRPPSIAPSVRSTISTRSVSTRSVASTISTVSSKKPTTIVRKTSSQVGTPKAPLSPARSNGQLASSASSIRTVSSKGKGKAKAAPVAAEHKKSDSTKSASSVATLKRKGSSDTITASVSAAPSPRNSAPGDPLPSPKPPASPQLLPPVTAPRGDTLDIGIPCIISSKRKRFKAYARYIGEVEGELGPWVGVEVPLGENWEDEMEQTDGVNGRQWHDGTWGGIKYFEISGGGNSGSEWEYGDDRASRRRRLDVMGGSGMYGTVKDKGFLKREGDQLSIDRAKRFRSASPATSDLSSTESRGLFVRPQQVLYVMDAVG